MGMSRALGGLLCAVCAVIAAFWVLFLICSRWQIDLLFFKTEPAPLWIALPIVIGIVVLAGLGFWLGWIMASTTEVSPPTPTPVRKKTKRK